MKSVMISIRPKWCDLIMTGEKIIEIRKTRPKMHPPFKCYIYQTLPKYGEWNSRDGKVVGEFMCSSIISIYPPFCGRYRGTCMSVLEMHEYAQGKRVYAWVISDLKVYDVPKKLDDFICGSSKLAITDDNAVRWSGMKKPPQSWCYVEIGGQGNG